MKTSIEIEDFGAIVHPRYGVRICVDGKEYPELSVLTLSDDPAELKILAAERIAAFLKENPGALVGPFTTEELVQQRSPTRTITLVITEERDACYAASPWPLIYDVEMDVYPDDEERGLDAAFEHSEELLDKVAAIRAKEVEVDVDRVREAIVLRFAFAGGCELLLDWRH